MGMACHQLKVVINLIRNRNNKEQTVRWKHQETTAVIRKHNL